MPGAAVSECKLLVMQDECGLRNWFLKAASENTEADTWWISKALGALSITEHHGVCTLITSRMAA